MTEPTETTKQGTSAALGGSELNCLVRCCKCDEELFDEEQHFWICEDCRAKATDLEALL